MRYLLPLIFLITSCVASSPSHVGYGDEDPGIYVRLTGVLLEVGREVDGEWNAVVQEIDFEDGTTLVECFRMEKGGVYGIDTHRWPNDVSIRHMDLYLAIVEGVDWSPNGFAHLPQNMDGTKVTDVSPTFNWPHQMMHDTRGKITKRHDSGICWRIDSDGRRMIVEIG